MNCEQVTQRMADRLAGTLSGEEDRQMTEHFAQCAACRAEAESLGGLWQRLGVLPDEEPSPDLRRRFYQALDEFQRQEAARRPSVWERWRETVAELWHRPGSRRLATAAASLVVGVVVGGLVFGAGGRSEVRAMRQQVESLEQLVAVSLLRQDSASARLQGVSYGRQAAPRDERVVAALVEAATSDPSANVRMAAIDALRGVGSRPVVRDRLVRSLDASAPPLVQLAVVDLLAAEAPPADRQVGRLLAEAELDPSVRAYLDNIDSLPRH